MQYDKSLIALIEQTVGVRRSYSWNDLYRVIEKLEDLMSEDDATAKIPDRPTVG